MYMLHRCLLTSSGVIITTAMCSFLQFISLFHNAYLYVLAYYPDYTFCSFILEKLIPHTQTHIFHGNMSHT